MAARFAAWRRGDRAWLVQSWAADRERARRRHTARQARGRRQTAREDQLELVESALELIRDGEMSRALRRLHSAGLGELTPGVLRQLARKHPERGWAVGAGCVPGDAPSILSSAPHRDLPDAASPSTAGPRRMSQRAPSGARGVFVRRCMPTDGLTDRVMGLYDDFATTAFCCGYPPWFYTAWSVAGLIPLIKQPLSDAARARGDDPDCRPVAVGSATA